LSKMLDDDSAAAAKRDFRLQTVGDSNENYGNGDISSSI
jgi:hypothetical protein